MVGRGTGLGLASALRVVESLGGTIACESAVGEGSTFRVRLPRATGQLIGAEGEGLGAGRARLRGARVLVVEDDAGVRDVVVRALEDAGAVCVGAANANDAQRVAKREAPFDLLWTDAVMPGGGGRRVIAWFNDHSPGSPVIVCTGYADDSTLRQEIADGRYRLLAKPFSPEQALDTCASVLRDAPRLSA